MGKSTPYRTTRMLALRIAIIPRLCLGWKLFQMTNPGLIMKDLMFQLTIHRNITAFAQMLLEVCESQSAVARDWRGNKICEWRQICQVSA